MKYIYCVLIISFGIFMYYQMYRKTKDLLNPFSIATICWCIPAGMSSLCLSYLQQTWDPVTYVIVFLFPLCIALVFYVHSRFDKIMTNEDKAEKFEFSNGYFFLTRIVFIIAIVCALYEWKQQDFVITLLATSSLGDIKSGWESVPFVHYGTVLIPYIAVCSLFEVIYCKNKKKWSYVFSFVIIGFSFFYNLFCEVSRGSLVILALGALYLLYRHFKHFNFKKIIIVIICIVIGLVFIMFRRVQSSSLVYSVIPDMPLFSSIYSYTAINFENLNKLVLNGPSISILGRTMGGILQFVGLGGLANFSDKYTTLIFNAVPIVYDFYDDAWIIGVVIYSCVLFFLIKLLYIKSCKDVRYVLLIAVLQKAIYCVFMGNYFSDYRIIIFPYIIIAIIVFSMRCSLRLRKS